MSRAPTKADVPEAVYGCKLPSCAEEVSYPAEMLYWHGGSNLIAAGFYCEMCWQHDVYDLADYERGIGLDEFMVAAE